jgi:putative glutamine amidotransferase
LPANQPRIAVTGSWSPGTQSWRPGNAYLHAVSSAKGEPFALQAVAELADARGLLLIGGGDVDPDRYGRERLPQLGPVDDARDELEIAAVIEALRADVPVLAICRGLQVLVVALGGTLWQDLPTELPGDVSHGRGAGRFGEPRATHSVRLLRDSLAARAAGALEFEVNSSHHQAAQVVGDALVISGWAPDGVIEAVEVAGAEFALGVQWHPEDLIDRSEHMNLFGAFVGAARHARTRPTI